MTRLRLPCPNCQKNGNDASGDNLHVYEDGRGGYCYRCQTYTPIEGDAVSGFNNPRNFQPREPANAGFDLAAIAKYPTRGWEERGISAATMARFGVKCTVDETNNQPDAFFFPYYDESGSITGYKKRKVASKEFSVIGKIKGLFGQQQAKGGGAFCIVVEGEIDQLSVAEMLSQRGKDWVTVSIPNGANEDGTPDKAVVKELEWITKHPRIAVAFDMDGPGQASGRALADMLVSRCLVKHVHMPVKDANEMLKRGMVDEFFKCLSNAKEHKPDQIVRGSDGGIEELTAPIVPGVRFSFMPKTSDKLRGFRTKEITTILAPPNVGKSSLLRLCAYDTLVQNPEEHVGGFFLEERVIKTKQSIVAYHAGIPLSRYREDPSLAHPDVVRDAYENLLPRLHLFEHKNKVITDEVIERKIEYMVQAQGCKSIFFDHLSFVMGGRTEGDERRSIDNLLTRLARSVEDLDYRLFLVSHIKRGAKEQSRRDTQKKYPYWEILDMDMGRGSGSIEQLSHNVLLLERQVLDPEEDNTRGLLRTRWARAREHGHVGVCDYLTMDASGKFAPVETDY